jgi:transcription termination factor Rho
MTVLDRSELDASPLSDLHLLAGELGVEGFRRMRKADLIDAILAHQDGGGGEDGDGGGDGDDGDDGGEDGGGEGEDGERAARRRPARTRRSRSGARPRRPDAESETVEERIAEGTIEILGNGSAFLRVSPPGASSEDVYISAAQVRRCELVTGDRVSGPVRAARRSERYPSLIRVQTINGEPADAQAEGPRYEELPIDWPRERIALRAEGDQTLQAIEWLTPIGLGSRALIVGGSHSGKTETLRRLLASLATGEGIEPMLVLSGVRPEEIGDWHQGSLQPVAALSFAASADAQGHAVEGAIETAKRLAVRGGNALVLLDSLDGLHPHTARRVLASARNLREAGSLTLIATASRPFGGETTVIALDAARPDASRVPTIDLLSSNTLKAELLVGDDGAQAIASAKAQAAEA